MKKFKFPVAYAVLILVLMDNQNTVRDLQIFMGMLCLNPCSNG